MQRIRSTVDEKEQKQLLMDLDVVMRSSDCDYIVKFYGALFTEVITFSPFQMTLKGYDNDYYCNQGGAGRRLSLSAVAVQCKLW